MKDFQGLELELEACREELTRIKAEYRDAVPQHDWDALQQTHQRTVLQVLGLHYPSLPNLYTQKLCFMKLELLIF